MNSAEAIAAVRAGGRAVTKHTKQTFPQTPEGCGARHRWCIVACNGFNDVGECEQCGTQSILLCFNEDYS